jgi:hypothetical protein
MKPHKHEPLLFCNVGWMDHYQGQTKGHDEIQGGGKYVREKGMGHEVCNFAPVHGFVFGYVQPAGEHISLERLGGSPDDDKLSGVTVVWTAKRPGGRTCVVGWHKNATVYRDKQRYAKPSSLHRSNRLKFFRIKARESDCTLLPVDERTCEIPRQTKGGMGQANVWYADSPLSMPTVKRVRQLLAGKKLVTQNRSGQKEKQDQERKARVEKAAIRTTIDHYESLGYTVRSVEKDNVGWDLEASHGKTKLLIEVKGLSGPNPTVELTPNEYRVFSGPPTSYRLAVVTQTLTKPKLRVCRYSTEQDLWIVDGDIKLTLDIRTKQSATVCIV